MHPSVLASIDATVAKHFPTLLSLLIERDGVLVCERSYQHGDLAAPANVKSVTKSIVSALVGIALREGDLLSLDQRVEEFFPQFFPAGGDQRKRAICLRHLLTMRSGLRWAEQSADSLPALFASPDWVQHALSLPLMHPPGEVFAYSTPDAHLLSAILTRATGVNTLAFANRSLFGPLGITATTWPSDPQGFPIGGSELSLTPREMAKVGSLYLRKGNWEGRQLMPAEYVEASTRTQVRPADGAFASATYGYLWWVTMVGPYASFYALGYGGQLICVIPALEVVFVTTARLDVPSEQGAGPRTFALARELAERVVLPALLAQES